MKLPSFPLLPLSNSASSDSMTELHSNLSNFLYKEKKKSLTLTTAKGLLGDPVTQPMKYYNIFVLCVFRYSFDF